MNKYYSVRGDIMQCSISELCQKDVINTCDGIKIGCVDDVKVDCTTGKIVALIISGKNGFFGMGKSDDLCIEWNCIEVIGNDTILVKCVDYHPPCKKNRTPLDAMFK